MKRVFYIEMMGEPGSYDATVYDHFEDKDKEGLWFQKRFSHVPGVSISTCNVCIGETLPLPHELDGIVLAGSYNSVHDNTNWQQEMRRWLPVMRRHRIPILAICGSHQLLSHMCAAEVVRFEDGPYAGTFPVHLTDAGKASPLMQGIDDGAGFQFANSEHVTQIPKEATLLATSGKVTVAALDYGNHCYSTQYHPDGTNVTLGTVWKNKAPERMKNYWPEDNGRKLIENFMALVVRYSPSVEEC